MRMHRLAGIAFLAVWVSVHPVSGQDAASRPTATPGQTALLPRPVLEPLAGDGMQVTVHRLANGLTVYLSPNHERPRITAWIGVRAGGKQDPEDSTGMAHYLEHMLFKGTRRLGTLDFEKEKEHLDKITELYEKLFSVQEPEERKKIYKEIDAESLQAGRYEVLNEIDKLYKSVGFSDLNAFTDWETTVYIADIPANRLELWARVESERFKTPVFRAFQPELETVYEEKNRSMDNAERILNEALESKVYKNHPYGQRTILGSIEHLKNPSLAKMYAFFDAYYRPNNMAAVLAGDFEPKEVLPLLEKYFGALEPKDMPAAGAWPLPPPGGVERAEVRYEAEEKVVIAWPTVAAGHPDADVLRVMDMLVDNAAAGILNLYLNQDQKVKSSGSYPEMRNDAGAWVMWANPKEGQTLEEAEALLLEVAAKLKAGDFADEDIKAVVTNFEVNDKKRLESNESRAQLLMDSFVSFEEWPYTAAHLERLRAVTKEEVLRAAAKYLGDNRVVAYRRKGKPEVPSIAKPEFTTLDIDPARESELFKEIVNMPAVPIEPKWLKKGLDYQVEEMAWGKLYAVKNPMNDLFSLDFDFERGRKHERNLCAAFSLLNLSGAGAMSAEDFKKALYRLGSSMSAGCGEVSSSVHLEGLDAHLEETLELMRQRFESPNVASGALEKLIQVQIGEHKDNKADVRYIRRALGEWAQRGKKSGVLSELSDAELRALKEEDLKSLIRDVWNWRRRAGYVGARGTDAAAGLLKGDGRKYLETPAHEPMRYEKPQKDNVIFVHRDMVQSLVGLFAADEIFKAENQVDYRFYSSYMGGDMSSVIWQEIRESRALAYSAGGGYSEGEYEPDENKVAAGLGCQADKTLEATGLLAQLIKKLPPSSERFQATKKSIEQRYRAEPIEFRSIPGTVIAWEKWGLAADPRPKNMQKAVNYALPQLQDFARRFENQPLTIYILGNRERVGLDGLKTLGEFREIPVDELFPY
ncbi:MAG: insulinase family protein [Elusimicrobia bacterium]|nr:insulinase family protein [Elusimicrobiota bacterium]